MKKFNFLINLLFGLMFNCNVSNKNRMKLDFERTDTKINNITGTLNNIEVKIYQKTLKLGKYYEKIDFSYKFLLSDQIIVNRFTRRYLTCASENISQIISVYYYRPFFSKASLFFNGYLREYGEEFNNKILNMVQNYTIDAPTYVLKIGIDLNLKNSSQYSIGKGLFNLLRDIHSYKKLDDEKYNSLHEIRRFNFFQDYNLNFKRDNFIFELFLKKLDEFKIQIKPKSFLEYFNNSYPTPQLFMETHPSFKEIDSVIIYKFFEYCKFINFLHKVGKYKLYDKCKKDKERKKVGNIMFDCFWSIQYGDFNRDIELNSIEEAEISDAFLYSPFAFLNYSC